MTSAAPKPIIARATITSPEVDAYIAVAAEAPATMIRPICKAPLRPNLSPKAPITRRVPPKIKA